MSNPLYEYVNGNYEVKIYPDGTKVRTCDSDKFIASRPESIDIKITNRCSFGNKTPQGIVNNSVCGYCHEQSHDQGRHADLNKVLEAIGNKNKGMEIAIGGGNALSHPDIIDFVKETRLLGIIPNVTHNQLHLKKNEEVLGELLEYIYGLGISYRGMLTDGLIEASEYEHFVLHVIAGIDDPEDVLKTMEKLKTKKVLILGYKDFGNGKFYKNTTVEKNKQNWFYKIGGFSKKVLDMGGVVLFDNIANDQLNIKRLFIDKNDYLSYYNGDDGSHTFYIDAVNEVYARNSTHPDRFDFNGMGVVDMFKDINNKLKK